MSSAFCNSQVRQAPRQWMEIRWWKIS